MATGQEGNVSFHQIRALHRHGDGTQAQASDGTGASGNLSKFASDGTLTDSAIAASSVALISAIQQEAYIYAGDTGAANAYAVTLSPAPTIVAGSPVVFKAANANTGASTLSVNGGAATPIKKQGSTDLASGDIAAGQIVAAIFDGTNWQLIGGGSSASSAPLATKGDLYGYNTAGARIPVGSDGQVLTADSTQALGVKWTAAASVTQPFLVVCYLAGKPGASANVLELKIPSNLSTVSFPANFSGSVASCGANPTASATYTILQNGSSIGTLVVSTSGAATFTTTGGTSKPFSAGDLLTIAAPGTQDATLSDVTITLAGTR